MAEKGLIEKSTLTAIADAIRAKLESSAEMLPSEMAAAIEAISTGAKIKKGSFTASSVTSKAITHGLGEKPNYAVIYNTSSSFSTAEVLVAYMSGSSKGGLATRNSTNTVNHAFTGTPNVTVDTSKITFSGLAIAGVSGGADYNGSYNYIIGVI